jgi:hypothetical protein
MIAPILLRKFGICVTILPGQVARASRPRHSGASHNDGNVT